MPLKEYADKRNFDVTPEPAPASPHGTGPTYGGFFCVQRHDASHLHYDFRLEVGGVLVSWAVPKGPSLDPARKPLAMKVEDHPLDYGTFEGNIPKGSYGGGSVMLWDKGHYEVLGDVSAEDQLVRGDFKFALHGTKLNGSFAIVHIKASASRRGSSKGNEWLLIKKKDEFVVENYNIDEFAWSVLSKRSQDQIASDPREGAHAQLNASTLPGAKKTAFPKGVDPMLATAVTAAPSGSQWLYEIKWDGVRAMAFIRDGQLSMQSRRGNQAEQQYPELSGLPKQLSVGEAVLDGEICVLDADGRARFQNIQPRIHANARSVPKLAETAPATYFVFDLLYADGFDLRAVPREKRRELLRAVLAPSGPIRLSETYETDGSSMFEAARNMGLEGILAKDRRSAYEGGRSSRWLKVKVVSEQEFVIAGFTTGEREYFSSLILAVNKEGQLHHAGQVGTGFDGKTLKQIYEKLKPLIVKQSSLAGKPRIKNAVWVKPELVCQVRFTEWTRDDVLRAPVFLSLRDDKVASDVVREEALEPASIAVEPATGDSGLDLSGKELTATIDGHSLKFSNLQKIFFPKDGWKKRDLLAFYDAAAPWLLPHLRDRPLSMKRYPNGIESDFFFQKNASPHFPSWMKCEPVDEHGGTKRNHYPIANDRATLLYLVNLGCIDQNPWMSRLGTLENPDWMLLDLDPVETGFDQIVEAVLLVRGILDELGLRGYPKTTGGDGMHIYVPLEPVYSFDQVRSFAEIVAHLAVERKPDLFTTPRSVNKRQKNRVYFDYLQIASRKTIAAPYVVRAYEGAPVATPLDWSEVKHGLQPKNFNLSNAVDRFRQVGDLFAPVLAGGQRLEDALASLKA